MIWKDRGELPFRIQGPVMCRAPASTCRINKVIALSSVALRIIQLSFSPHVLTNSANISIAGTLRARGRPEDKCDRPDAVTVRHGYDVFAGPRQQL